MLTPLLALVAQVPYPTVQIGTPLPPPSGVTAERYPGTARVVLEDVGEVEFLDEDDPAAGYTMTESARVKVLSAAGRVSARQVHGISGFTTVDSVAGRSYADAAEDRGLAQVTASSGVQLGSADLLAAVYGDLRTIVFDVPRVDVGDVIETRVRTTTRDRLPFARWYVGRDVPVVLSRYAIKLPHSWTLDARVTRDERAVDAPPACTPLPDGWRRCEWRFDDVAPVRAEVNGMPVSRRALQLAWTVRAPDGGFGRWEDVGRWYRALQASLPAPGPEVLARAEGEWSRSPGSNDEERIFRWVRDHIRYVYAHRGLGAYRAHPVETVLERGWGDCKDTTGVLLALLRQRGIAAYPALVAGSARPTREAPPSLEAFDHVIVAVRDGDTYRFLDGVDKEGTPGVIGQHLRGRRALVIEDARVVDLDIPWVQPSDRYALTWDVDARGGLRLSLDVSGAWATTWRVAARHSPVVVKSLVLGLLADARGAEVTEVQVVEGGDGAVRVEGAVTAPALNILSGSRVVRALGALFDSAHEVRVAARRDTPIELGRPGSFEERVRVARPEGAKLLHAPAPREVSVDGLTVAIRTEDAGDVIEVTKRFAITTPALPADRAADYAAVAAAIHHSAVDAVIFEVSR